MPRPGLTAARAFPVSVKGVAVQAGKVLLLEMSGLSGNCPAGNSNWVRTRPNA
jgi:hypothetical protein